ncbi:MFS transporter [Amycolatopsis alkalitolerans]|uniref:MFS transporter n=1 Tax=Amycolatopsis alkalitolerans TaxID=2547244 RepID=A0A5C4LY94_9PSEU|nr:MFS transporter [Amycolatopsis alkalitolerans]TNC24669.1 MFS transporter [Amycolatopsis alkalitolerans]
MRSTLANVEFRTVWLAEAQSTVGDQLTIVALALMVYQRTGSALLSAIAYALTFLPALAGGLGLAQLADRFPRRSVLAVSAAVQAVFVGAMAIPGMPLVPLCVLVVLARLAGAPSNAAQNALTREIFSDDERYLRSQDIRGITTNTAMLLGLASGGFLVTAAGPSVALAIDAATFAISALALARWVSSRPAADNGDGSWFGAIRWVAGQHRLRVLLGLSWLVGLAVIPEGLVAPLAREIGAPDQAVGWLLAADPLGFVLGVFLMSRYVSAQARKRALGVLAIVPTACLLVFSVRPDLVLSLVALAAAGAAGAYIVTVGASFITWVPNELRGGAGGLYRTGLRVAQGLGVAVGGAVAQWLGSATTAIAVAGAAGVLLGIPLAVSWARLQRDETETAGAL